jgi:hypothetical protein
MVVLDVCQRIPFSGAFKFVGFYVVESAEQFADVGRTWDMNGWVSQPASCSESPLFLMLMSCHLLLQPRSKLIQVMPCHNFTFMVSSSCLQVQMSARAVLFNGASMVAKIASIRSFDTNT